MSSARVPMVLTYVSLGRRPSNEADPHRECPGDDRRAHAFNECQALVHQLLRAVGPPADEATGFVIRFTGPAELLEVGLIYNPQSPAAVAYRDRCQRDFPATWDFPARLQLASARVPGQDGAS